MENGNFPKLTAAMTIFLLLSSAVIPVFADGFKYGTGSTAADGGVAIGNGASGGIAIGSSYDSLKGASGSGIAIGSGTSNGGVAIGTGANQNAVGNGATGLNAFGNGANAGDYTAVGAGAKSTGINGVAVGYKATAKAGGDSYRWGGNGSSVIGANATAGDRSEAFGFGSTASAANSAAFGANSGAVTSSVALGYGSVANRSNSISVGSAGHERQVTNVADGRIDTDAATTGQLNKVGAMAAAISGLTPLPYNGTERLQILTGGGNYAGQSAAAIGVGYYDTNKSLMMTAGLAFSGCESMTRLGLAWRLGHAGKETLLAAGVDPQATIHYQDTQLQRIQRQINQQQEQAKRQQEQDKKQQAQLKQLQEQIDQLLKKQKLR